MHSGLMRRTPLSSRTHGGSHLGDCGSDSSGPDDRGRADAGAPTGAVAAVVAACLGVAAWGAEEAVAAALV